MPDLLLPAVISIKQNDPGAAGQVAAAYRNWERLTLCAGYQLELVEGHATTRPDARPGYPLSIEGGWLIRFPDGREYRVAVNKGLRVDLPSPLKEPDEEHQLRLAGPLTAMVIAACRLFPLHAVGLRAEAGVTAVFAPSGGGKSTLASIAAAEGLEILGDDILAVTHDADVIGLEGSLRIGVSDAPPGWAPAFVMADGRGWYPLNPPHANTRLLSLILLERGGSPALTAVRGVRRHAILSGAGFLTRFQVEPDEHIHTAILDIVSHIRVWELQIPDGVDLVRRCWPEIRMLIERSCG